MALASNDVTRRQSPAQKLRHICGILYSFWEIGGFNRSTQIFEVTARESIISRAPSCPASANLRLGGRYNIEGSKKSDLATLCQSPTLQLVDDLWSAADTGSMALSFILVRCHVEPEKRNLHGRFARPSVRLPAHQQQTLWRPVGTNARLVARRTRQHQGLRH